MGTKLHSALSWLEKNLSIPLWRVIALAAVIGLAGCGAKGFGTPLSSSDAVAPYVDGSTEDGSTYTVEEKIQWLREHPGQDLPWGGPIRVFRKQAFMDEWGPLERNRFMGDPKNLQTGEIYTLDHRRLVAYRLAGRKTIPVELANSILVRDQRWKFTTLDRGRSIAPSP